MTATERNDALRRKLDHRVTCGVPVKDDGTPAPDGWRFCLRCNALMTVGRAKTHRQVRCRGNAVSYGTFEYPADYQPVYGCLCIIVKPPIVREPRAPKPIDPFEKLRARRDDAADKLAEWETKLTLAMTKMKEYRGKYRRATKALEDAVAGIDPRAKRHTPVKKTRRIQVPS